MNKRTNEEWVLALKSVGQKQEEALSDLRKIIHSSLPYSLNKWMQSSDPRFEPLADEVSQETLLRILDKLDTFEGRSQFTTWVNKIAVRIALTELRRRQWKDVSLDELLDKKSIKPPSMTMSDVSSGPEISAEQKDILSRIEDLITNELTAKQRNALVAISIHGMPIEEVARRMNTSRNALYKLLHDARLRLKERMKFEGLSPEEVLEMFESG
jgi:RNA polymerase sigma-70 factor (ECF subfamily)